MKVKTCPFCGGKPYLESSQRGYVDGESTKVCYVRCRKCNARSPRLNIKDFGHTSRSVEAIEKVVEMWNSRVENYYEVEINTNKRSRDSELVLSPLYMDAPSESGDEDPTL